jgi:nucleotidyltransferase substrate binding protein (TIGR01987 family)
MDQRLFDTLSNLRRANASLHLALQTSPRNPLVVAAIIKNFEFNYELSWKAMRRLLAFHGVVTSSPRQALGEGYQKRFIDDEKVWISMIEDRNLTVHTYDETFARLMAKRVEENYLGPFDALLQRLELEVAQT